MLSLGSGCRRVRRSALRKRCVQEPQHHFEDVRGARQPLEVRGARKYRELGGGPDEVATDVTPRSWRNLMMWCRLDGITVSAAIPRIWASDQLVKSWSKFSSLSSSSCSWSGYGDLARYCYSIGLPAIMIDLSPQGAAQRAGVLAVHGLALPYLFVLGLPVAAAPIPSWHGYSAA
jgi:hypothetical protein